MRKLWKAVQMRSLVSDETSITSIQGKQAMVACNSIAHGTKTDTTTDFDAIIVGAGVSGLYQLYKTSCASSV